MIKKLTKILEVHGDIKVEVLDSTDAILEPCFEDDKGIEPDVRTIDGEKTLVI